MSHGHDDDINDLMTATVVCYNVHTPHNIRNFVGNALISFTIRISEVLVLLNIPHMHSYPECKRLQLILRHGFLPFLCLFLSSLCSIRVPDLQVELHIPNQLGVLDLERIRTVTGPVAFGKTSTSSNTFVIFPFFSTPGSVLALFSLVLPLVVPNKLIRFLLPSVPIVLVPSSLGT